MIEFLAFWLFLTVSIAGAMFSFAFAHPFWVAAAILLFAAAKSAPNSPFK